MRIHTALAKADLITDWVQLSEFVDIVSPWYEMGFECSGHAICNAYISLSLYIYTFCGFGRLCDVDETEDNRERKKANKTNKIFIVQCGI